MMKKLWIILLAVAMVLSIAACGTTENTTAAPKPASLTYWYWADNTEQSDLMQNIVKSFNETNTMKITVTAEEYPWNSGGFTDTIFTAIMGGGGPDMSTFKLQAGKMFAANKLLADMTTHVDAWGDKAQLNDGIWTIMKNATGDNTLSILPWTLEALYVYYRPSYFEQAGITKTPATFTEFLEAIEKCTMDTNNDGKTDIYGFGMRGAGGGQEHLGAFLYAYGATWDDLTTPQAVEGYKAYLNLFEEGFVPESSPNAAFAEIVDGFKTGLTAMVIHHIGSSKTWIDTFGEDVDAFVVPGSDKGQWTAAGDTELVVYEQSENKAAAFEFYKYMTTGEGGTTWFKTTGKGLGTNNVKATPEFTSNRFQAVAAASLQIAGVLPPTDTIAEFSNSVWAGTNQQALLGQITAEKALEIMNKAIHGD
ncbi:MAG TPA: sugar ABC transporter substrate-binding protein [Clostridiales bacterium]|nr:sugar ABC transporter substrate-binding protein [Clostridiales bacterium]